MKILLKDKTTFDVLETSTIHSIEVEYGTVEEIEVLRASLTNENLDKFSFTDDKGNIIGSFEGCVFSGNVSYTATDSGTYRATFSLRMKTVEEKQAEEIEALKAAILELSDTIFGEEVL